MRGVRQHDLRLLSSQPCTPGPCANQDATCAFPLSVLVFERWGL